MASTNRSNVGGTSSISSQLGYAAPGRHLPRPIKFLGPQGKHGEVKIIKPADPEKVAAYHAELAAKGATHG